MTATMTKRSAEHTVSKTMPVFHLSIARAVLAGTAACLMAGCGSPSKANIELRKQNQQLEAKLLETRHQLEADERVIAGLRERLGTLPTLPEDRLAKLFTTHGLEFGRLTGGADLDPNKPGDEGLAVYLDPTDQTGQVLKAAGSFDIDAFDLAESNDPHIGHWHFSLEEAKNAWNGFAFVYAYALICPWQELPKHQGITVRVTFLDELSQTAFHAEEVVHVSLPPQATSQPASARR
jgi:hypothetical protein